MREQIEGSKAVAKVIAACAPHVICAYPISPQTHIVEELSRLAKVGDLPNCEYVNVESEFAAMSVAIGASATGARAYTATASQGLLYMVEAVYNASGMRLPIVMTVANRAIGGPINIWNDHGDAMSQRDCGWIQLYAEDNQEAADLHVQAFRIAEIMSMPVMVCMDGFILTHAVEPVDVPEREQVERYLPDNDPRQKLDPQAPITIGSMVGPEAFTEVRYLAHLRSHESLEVIEQAGAEFEEIFGRASGGLLRTYRCEDAETIVVALGSLVGTLKDVIDTRREAGERIGVLSLCSFRPFPDEAIVEALRGARRVIVAEKAFSVGIGGIVTDDVRRAFGARAGEDGLSAPEIRTVVMGLGGRPITQRSLHTLLDGAADLEPLTFMDLDRSVIEAELERGRAARMRRRALPDEEAGDRPEPALSGATATSATPTSSGQSGDPR